MGKKDLFARLRNLLISKAYEMGNQGATTDEVVNAVISENPKIISEANGYLLRMALGRLFGQAREKGPPSVDPSQLTLWGAFDVSPQIRVRSNGGETVYKNLDLCTFEEVENYANSLPNRRQRSSRKNGYLQMIETCRPFRSSDSDLIGICWRVAIGARSAETA